MGKPIRKAPPKDDHYAFIRANVRLEDGELSWDYRLNSGRVVGHMKHDDEDVSSWTDEQIIQLTKQELCVKEDDPVAITVIWD